MRKNYTRRSYSDLTSSEQEQVDWQRHYHALKNYRGGSLFFEPDRVRAAAEFLLSDRGNELLSPDDVKFLRTLQRPGGYANRAEAEAAVRASGWKAWKPWR
jgi:hypothetical protein